ncbi:MAG: class I SAM-dependent methyltransferase [Candidatus Woesearchaeota archaeon]
MSKKKFLSSKDIFDRLSVPSIWKTLPITRKEGEFIYDFVKKNNLKHTLETGLGFGGSAAFIISASGCKHIAIDPFYKTPWDKSIATNNLRRLGLSRLLKHYEDYSHNVLPQLYKKGLKLDFAFIDGDHKYDNIFVDFYYVDLMLKKGGYILFDDAGMRTTQLVASFIRKNKENYSEIETEYPQWVILFKKIGTDKRRWWHFKEFHNKKGIDSHKEFEKYDYK